MHPIKTDRPHRNIVWQRGEVSAAQRVQLFKQEAAAIWLTGLSGSGKSTVAFKLEQALMSRAYPAYVLDGDNVRHGLNGDLGFSPQDRKENIRRIAEVARLFNDAGMMVITAFISPYRQDRAMAREIIGADRFLEVHLATSLAVCEQRDPKGLYRKARQGEIADFTGISAPYEAPEHPALTIDSANMSVSHCVEQIIATLSPRLQANYHGHN